MTRIVAATLALLALLAPAVARADTFTVKTLHFDTVVGPNNDTHCDVIGDLYRPSSATAANPAAAVLATNGFGGSKDDQATLAKAYAARGYVVLSYSGLGFGGSGCKIELDDPDWDGKAGSQLVSFLGGSKAATDGTKVDYVIHDRTAHDGKHYPDDPRVGMIGGSYGGQIQFSIAGIDPRLDAIVPQITWNDLSYSLTPNNTSFTSGVTYTTPGVPKAEWAALFSALGVADGVQATAQFDTSHLGPCPNFDPRVCPGLVNSSALGYPDDTTLQLLRHASVSSYMDHIRIPTLLAQGQTDTLFDLQESVATYRALRARNVPVKLLWRSAGHSGGDLKNSENDESDPEAGYESRMELEWLDWYLRGLGDAPRLDFSYYRDWIPYKGDAAPAVGEARSYPAASPVPQYLSGSDSLVGAPGSVQAGTASFTTTSGGAPASYTETSALDQSGPLTDTPGTFAQYTSAPLASDLDVVGVPTVTLHLSAPTFAGSSGAGPGGMLVLFLKLEDVAPDGTATLPHRLIAPVRIADPTKPVQVELPGIAHRFAKGDRVRLVVASSDAAYKGDQVSGPVSVVADPKTPDALVLPRSDPGAAGPGQPAGLGGPPPSAQSASLPSARRCASRRSFVIHLRRVRRPDRVVRATVLVNGKRTRVITGRRLRARVNLRGLPRGTFRVMVELRTHRGRVLRSARTYHTCVAKKRS
jgi:predicted acyl esterase